MEKISIFPILIGKFRYDQPIKPELIEYSKKYDVHNNEGNLVSNQNYVLKDKKFTLFKKFFEESLNFYFYEAMRYVDCVKPVITQSWLNFTSYGQYHHRHSHPNSFLSGVFYIDSNFEDKIFFDKTDVNRREFSVPVRNDEYNFYNSSSWWLPAETGVLYIFPSNLPHLVQTKQSDNIRISLAFNTFFDGTIGENKSLTELKLKSNYEN